MKFALTNFVLLMSISIFAQNFDKDKMDQFFQLLEENDQAMGSIAIYKEGVPVYQRSIGYADLDEKIKAHEQTKYRIGSISKTFTACVIMQMVEEGKLSLNTPLSDFYPEVPNAQKIDMEQLLRHRSGLFNLTNKPDFPTWMESPQEQKTMLDRIIANGTNFEPNTKTEYSNTNYVLLSWIAEKVDKSSFDKIIDQRISQKNELKETYLGDKINSANNEALSYARLVKWTKAPETHPSVPLGAGALVSSSNDLNQFVNLLFSGKIVKLSSLDKMKTMVDGLGLGLLSIPFYDKKAIGHNGRIDGFESSMAYFPDEKVSIAYLSNGVNYAFNDIMIGVLSIYFGKDYDLPQFKPALELSSEELEPYLGIYGSPGFPLKITISKKENQLMGQATGQPAFPLEASEKDIFKFAPAGVVLEFVPQDNQMTLKQGGGVFVLKKE